MTSGQTIRALVAKATALPVLEVVDGWQIAISRIERAKVVLWDFSAQLYPKGRGSTVHDWGRLGGLLALVADATGKDGMPPEPGSVTTSPNAVHHFIWSQEQPR